MFDSTHKENIKKKHRKTITPIVYTKKLCICQDILLRGHRDRTKNHPEVRKMILLIQEILKNYYCVNSREGTKTLETSFRMPHDILLQLIFVCFDFLIFQGKL